MSDWTAKDLDRVVTSFLTLAATCEEESGRWAEIVKIWTVTVEEAAKAIGEMAKAAAQDIDEQPNK